MKMNPVVHFEMPYKSGERVAGFYSKVFGWQSNIMGAEMGNYIVTMTAESTKKGPKKPGSINGGFFPRTKKNSIPSFVIGVGDIKEHMKKVTKAGGKIFGKPVEIPGVGWYVSFKDTEGNKVSLLQPSRK